MIDDINEIRALATKYSVQQLRNLADLKLLDPIKAVMAGNMINHIQKQNAKPPSTSVAQDLLGIQQPMPMQGQQQPMPPQQASQQPPQQPPQMAQAPAGIEGLPAGDVGNYAGGGIVAFDDGGYVPKYAGADGSVTTSSPVGRGLSKFFGGRTYSPDVTQQLKALDEQYQALAARDRQLNGMFGFQQQTPEQQTESAKVKQQMQEVFQQSQSLKNTQADPAAAPAVDQSAAETARLQRQNTILNPIGRDNNIPPPPLPSGERVPAPPVLTASKPIEPPTLGAFDPNAVKLTGPKMDMPKVEALSTIAKEREAAEAAEGFNKNLTAEQIKRIEDKQKKLEDFESRAGGEALMNFGLGLLGAKRGQEWETVGKSGQAALSAYKSDVKDLRSAKEKLDERSEALRLADNQAKKTNSAADIAKRDAQVAKYDAAKLAVYTAENELTKTQAQVSASVYGAKAQAGATVFSAQLSAQTQREVANLNAKVQQWIYSRPPAEIQTIEGIAQRTGKSFEVAMKEFYQGRYGSRNVLTDEDVLKMATKNLSDRAIVNPTQQQIQQEAAIIKQAYAGIQNGNVGGGGTLQPGPNGTQTYVPRQ